MPAVLQDVQLRFAEPQDTAQIGVFLEELSGPFFHERFPDSTAADFYRWKYFSSPYGHAVVGLAVAATDKIVGIVSAMPKSMQFGARCRRVYELGDFMVDAEYRGRGLFKRLIEMVTAEAAQRGGELAYVRPNDTSFPILTRIGFRELQQIHERHYPVPSETLNRRVPGAGTLVRALGSDALMQWIGLPSLSGDAPRLERVESFGKEADAFWDRAASGYGACLARTAEYLNWRYVQSPAPFELWIARRGGDMAGLAVTFRSPGSGVGFLIDAFAKADDDSAAAAIVRHSFRHLLDQGSRAIYCWTAAHGQPFALLSKLRRACPRSSGPILHVALRGMGEPLEEPSGYWHLGLGDFDGF